MLINIANVTTEELKALLDVMGVRPLQPKRVRHTSLVHGNNYIGATRNEVLEVDVIKILQNKK